jgi:hypothetical protein
MKVVFEVNEKSIALAKAVLLQATDSEEKERLIRDACSRCGNDMTVELNVAELDVEKARGISFGLALLAISKMVDHEGREKAHI